VRFQEDSSSFEEFQKESKSQEKEDLATYKNIFCGVRNGFFFEAGAIDGVLISNTWAFEKVLGWKGILIEGQRQQFANLKKNRPNSITVSAPLCSTRRKVHYAEHPIKEVSGIVEFMADPFIDRWYEGNRDKFMVPENEVECYPLQDIFDFFQIRTINFFSLDMEGGEEEVLRGLDLSIMQIDVILAEARGDSAAKDTWVEQHLLSHGYRRIEVIQERKSKLGNQWYIASGFTPLPCSE